MQNAITILYNDTLTQQLNITTSKVCNIKYPHINETILDPDIIISNNICLDMIEYRQFPYSLGSNLQI